MSDHSFNNNITQPKILRSGIASCAIEIVRFKHFQGENRLCELCDLGEVESPIFFLWL